MPDMIPKDLLQYANKVDNKDIESAVLRTFQPAETTTLQNITTTNPANINLMNGDSLQLSVRDEKLGTLNAHRNLVVTEYSFEKRIGEFTTVTVKFMYT